MNRPFLYWLLAVLVLVGGGYLRFHLLRNPAYELGFDEKVYVAYVERLEERGIGRPSTYAPILSTIQDRGYVERDGHLVNPEVALPKRQK